MHTNARSGADGGRRLCEVLVTVLNVQQGWGCALHLELSLFICFSGGNMVFCLSLFLTTKFFYNKIGKNPHFVLISWNVARSPGRWQGREAVS